MGGGGRSVDSGLSASGTGTDDTEGPRFREEESVLGNMSTMILPTKLFLLSRILVSDEIIEV